EFDYSGTQACKALRSEGFEIVLINSNPATIMTDPEIADRTYVEPLTPEAVRAVIERERPDAMLPTVGGQTGLNIAVALAEDGTLERFGVELIGAKLEAIKIAEDRLLFKQAMEEIGLEMPRSGYVKSMDEARKLVKELGYSAIIRPSFTLGGTGAALASKATGFPIAKIAAKLAVGYTLDEIPNDITRKTPASFEPTIDYCVVKIPKWAFEKFPASDPTLGTQMKSVGEAMAIGRTFKEAFQKGLRSLEVRSSF